MERSRDEPNLGFGSLVPGVLCGVCGGTSKWYVTMWGFQCFKCQCETGGVNTREMRIVKSLRETQRQREAEVKRAWWDQVETRNHVLTTCLAGFQTGLVFLFY